MQKKEIFGRKVQKNWEKGKRNVIKSFIFHKKGVYQLNCAIPVQSPNYDNIAASRENRREDRNEKWMESCFERGWENRRISNIIFELAIFAEWWNHKSRYAHEEVGGQYAPSSRDWKVNCQFFAFRAFYVSRKSYFSRFRMFTLFKFIVNYLSMSFELDIDLIHINAQKERSCGCNWYLSVGEKQKLHTFFGVTETLTILIDKDF